MKDILPMEGTGYAGRNGPPEGGRPSIILMYSYLPVF